MNNRIKVEELNGEVYYQIPKWFMDLFISGEISSGAFKTYVLMYERLRMSAKNNWIDEDGDVYIKYSYNELMEDLQCSSKTTVSNNLKELQKLDLIDKVKCFSASNIYYLKVKNLEDCNRGEKCINSSTENCTSAKNCTISSTEKCTTEVQKTCTDSSTENLYSSKNNFKKNNSSKNNFKKNNTESILETLEQENISLELKNKIKEFILYRKEIKKTIQTYTVISKILNQIGTKYIDENHLILSIEDCMANQYQGIFPIKPNKFIRPVQQETPAMKMLKAMKGGVENDRY